MKILAYIGRRKMWALMLATIGVSMTSCDAILGEEDVDCSIEYRVKFKYDKNMKFADAFAHEVEAVTVYAFDDDGKFVYQRTEEGAMLGEDGYTMPVEIQPGDYHLVSWAKGNGTETFSVPVLQEGVSTLDELTCMMDRIYSRAADGTAEVRNDLRPLFHGEVSKISLSRAASTQIVEVPLTKNTNNVRIVLQHLSNEPVDIDKFEFNIRDKNGLMNYDNNLLEDDTLIYYAWDKYSGTAGMDKEDLRATTTSVSVAIAELTVGRLLAENEAVLYITNKGTGEPVLSIPLIDYALLVKGNYNRDMSDQEYLDRQDEYNMTFFLDENDKWVSSSIIINSWKVVLDNVDL